MNSLYEKNNDEEAPTESVELDASTSAEEEGEKIFKNLVILPPLQKKEDTFTATGGSHDAKTDAILLPSIRAEEPTSSIRSALSEIRGYSHLTNYRFVLENREDDENMNGSVTVDNTRIKSPPETIFSLPTGASPYTGLGATISTRIVVKSFLDEVELNTSSASVDKSKDEEEVEMVLNEYGDLNSLLIEGKNGLKNGSAFRIVLERYDIALIRDHICRLRSLLNGNAPHSVSLDDGDSGDSVSSPSNHDNVKSEDEHQTDNKRAENSEEKSSVGKENVDNTEDEKRKLTKQNHGNDVGIKPKYAPYLPIGNRLSPDMNDLKNFFYYACGEDPILYLDDFSDIRMTNEKVTSKSKKKGKKKISNTNSVTTGIYPKDVPIEQLMKTIIPRLNEVEEKTRICCNICFSGFHPPPKYRQMMGDLAYLEVTLPNRESVSISATSLGFFVNRSSITKRDYKFDPSPAATPCFSHELLDCLLLYSKSFCDAWNGALKASRIRNELMLKINEDGPFHSFFRVAIRGDFPGYSKAPIAAASEGIDALIQVPSWLVPIPRVEVEADNSWNRTCEHVYNPAKTEDDISNSFGLDIRGGSLRDWNEELQVAREMPMGSLIERIERARVLNKVLSDFGEAVLLGVKAISDGQVTSMNPNEPWRSQVFLHNNIFFSRAVDAGLETFKVAKGDKAARKSASRDLHCLGALHRVERTGLHTLATVIVDYLGSRFVCQSVLPGILSGEKNHTLLYGAVETGVPLVWDKEMHELFENTLGKGFMIATRPMPRQPLTPKRLAEIEDAKLTSPLFIGNEKSKQNKNNASLSPTIDICAPLEAKGIRGSDQRKYVLDMTRLTPRDANWVPKNKGGTGKWDFDTETSETLKDCGRIPESLDDEEWTLAVLRSELISSYAQIKMSKYVQEKKKLDEDDKSKIKGDKLSLNGTAENNDKSKDDLAYLNSLRFNVNVFLPDIQTFEGIGDDAAEQIRKDEEMVRNAAIYLWDNVIPCLTRDIRLATVHTVPHDGKSLTEFLHQRGINCRYLGRVAELAQVEEKKDHDQIKSFKENRVSKLDRRKMPLFWLELLECEMIARAAKHILDRYLSFNISANFGCLSQVVASFLCALVSAREETAGETENRMERSKNCVPDEEELSGLTLFQTSTTKYLKSRHDVWSEIEDEIGRRFRYNLTIFNQTVPNDRTPYIPLLRRVCQRNGIRLAAKAFNVGLNCLYVDSGSGGPVGFSYPISALDIIDIVPLMKHSAAHSEGFVPCGFALSNGLPALHISLPDARSTLETAHLYHNKKLLSRALDLAQEAAMLYQRVCDTPAHPGVVRCIDLMGSILYDAGEPKIAAANAGRALGFQTQISGFDSPDVINLHFVMYQCLVAAGEPSKAIKHMKAAIYLMELIGGRNHLELSNAYHKVGTVYHGMNDLETARRFYQEATARDSCDRLLEAMISKSSALVLAGLGDFKSAVVNEKRAYQLFSVLLGGNHSLAKQSDHALNNFMRAAVEQGTRVVDKQKKKKKEEAAQAIASEIEAEEAAEEVKRKKKNQKKKKKRK